ncbi:MAG TPA: DUF3592 domain-containing protein [Mycobacteriales bacterium]|nr:DUF3592 domain-containing protein [Mycobacteriales bacterium]
MGTLLIAFTLLLAGGVVSDFLDARALRDHGVYADGVIVKVHHGFGRGRDYVVAEFTTRDGRQVTAEVDNIYWRPVPQVGDRTSVVYDPAKPADNVADAGRGPDYIVPWGYAVVAVILGAGSVAIVRNIVRIKRRG